MHFDRGTLLGERYAIEGVLGRGGMGVVYVAHDQRLGVPVAVKVLSTAGARVRERLMLEGQVQAALRHPNVLNVTDIVTIGGLPGIVMEHVRGPDLDRLIKEDLLDEVDREHIARGVIAGLAAAHAHGVVHRDLKPSNVLVQPVEGALIPKIADFGLVKVLDGSDSPTRTGVAMGTPRYMAPEQFESAARVGPAADLFSLGATLYELFAGRPAFEGATAHALYRAIREGDHRPLVGPAGRICDAVHACLEPDPARRPKSAQAVLAMLDQGGGPPPPRFLPETLERARALTPAPSIAAEDWPLTMSLPSGQAPMSETVDAPPPSATASPARPQAASTQPQTTSPAPPTRGPSRGALVAGVVAAAGLGIGGWLLSSPTHDSFTPEGPPEITDGPKVERLLRSAWEEGLDNEAVDAFAHLNQAIESGANDPAVHLMLASAHFGFQDWDGFVSALNRGVELAPDDPDDPVASLMHTMHTNVHRESDLRWWGPTLDAHLERFPDDLMAKDLLSSGMYFDMGEDIDYRPKLPDWYLATFPDRVGPYVQALELKRVHGDLDGAEAALREGLERFPRSAALWAGSSYLAIERGRPDQARRDAQKCLQLDSGWHPCLPTVVQANIRLNDDPALERALDPLLEDTAGPGAMLMLVWGAEYLRFCGRRHEFLMTMDVIEARLRERQMDQTLIAMLTGLASQSALPGMSTEADLRNDINAAAEELAAPGLAAARVGRMVQALQIVQAIREGDRAQADSRLTRVRPTRDDTVILAMERAAFDGDLEPLQTATGCRPRVVAGLHLVAAAAAESALAVLRDLESESVCSLFYDPDLVALAHAARALAHHDLGDGAAARSELEAMTVLWRSPDPEIPIVAELARKVSPTVLGPSPLQTWLRRRDVKQLTLAVAHPCLAAIDDVVFDEAGLQVELPSEEGCQAIEASVLLAAAPAPTWR